MRVDHGRRDVLVPQEFLDGPDIVARFEEVGGETVAERMGADGLGEICQPARLLHGPLELASPI